ncbi:MAG TPA: NADP(H)-dependent aldo-keto reductase [Dongiaceae bacterium]|nr:NADP(H)-dependent aldo-keto reductase [Dongiaceae bacterium]
MEYRRLGRTDLRVSAICLGTMTWGRQNGEAEGHAQMDYALERGVTFWDTAEMYPVPPTEERFGDTERIVGTWFASRKRRDKVILATKIIGPDSRFKSIRGGDNRFDRPNITAAIDASLARLKTDYIDLYQLHWPERSVNAFGRLLYQHRADEAFTPFEEVLGVLGEAVRAGKIRHAGLSNETAWGAMRWLKAAEDGAGPRMASIQNCYHLMNRMFEVGLAEVAIREQCGLLAFSPMAMGTLSGKYLDGARPAGARMTLFPNFPRYMAARAQEATAAYVGLARKHGLDPAQMALAWVTAHEFVTATIIGATSMDQLRSNIASMELKLPADLLKEIEELHRVYTIPVP